MTMRSLLRPIRTHTLVGAILALACALSPAVGWGQRTPILGDGQNVIVDLSVIEGGPGPAMPAAPAPAYGPSLGGGHPVMPGARAPVSRFYGPGGPGSGAAALLEPPKEKPKATPPAKPKARVADAPKTTKPKAQPPAKPKARVADAPKTTTPKAQPKTEPKSRTAEAPPPERTPKRQAETSMAPKSPPPEPPAKPDAPVALAPHDKPATPPSSTPPPPPPPASVPSVAAPIPPKAKAEAKSEASLPPATGVAPAGENAVRIVFPGDDSKLPAGAQNSLKEVAGKLKAEDALRLQLLAYAGGGDLTASKARRLSLSRALAVRSYLIENGVRSTRIDVRALGDKTAEQPLNRVDVNLVTR